MTDLPVSEKRVFLDKFYRIEGSIPDLATYGPKAVPLLIELFDKEPQLRARAIRTLCQIDSQEAKQFVLSKLSSDDIVVRAAIAIGLRDWSEDELEKPVRQLLEDAHPSVQRHILMTVGELGMTQFKEEVLSLSKTAKNKDVKLQATESATRLRP